MHLTFYILYAIYRIDTTYFYSYIIKFSYFLAYFGIKKKYQSLWHFQKMTGINQSQFLILLFIHLSQFSCLVAIAEQIPLNTHAQYSYLLIAIRSKHMPHTNTARNSCLQKDTPLFSRQAIYKNKLYLFPTMNACNYNYNLVVFIITKQSIILLNMNY